MRFRPSREQLEFAGALRDMLADADTPSVIRSWSDGDHAPGRNLWWRLADMGVFELDGYPVELVLASEELGRAAAPGPYVESIAVLPALLPAFERGSMATVAVPPHVPYALDAAVADAVYVVEAGTISTAAVDRELRSVDGARRLAEVHPVAPVARVDPARAFELGVLATAAYQQGAGTALLERASGYAKQRQQFGQPIGSFQAVKHLLADAAVALELSRPLLFGAALALDTATAGRDVSAAKVACTDAAYLAARTALQVHGAIGYTAEYDLALWLTKVRALTSAWGTTRFHRDRIWSALSMPAVTARR